MVMSLDKLIKEFDLKIKGVIHIGAHWGEEEPAYSAQGIKNMLFFEPVKSNYDMMISHLPDLRGIKTYNLALGNTEGKMKMFTETWNKGQSCSLLKPELHLRQYPHIQFDGEEEVEVGRLDNIEFDRTLFNMINIDVQGFELEVFKGGAKTLYAIDIIYSEVNRAEVYHNCVKVEELDEYLGTFGFKRVKTDWIGKSWGDALFLKR